MKHNVFNLKIINIKIYDIILEEGFMEKTLTLNDFTILMIATLADNSKIIDLVDQDKKIAVIPVDYKQRIQNIMCAENGWKEEFSTLINVNDYFEDHFAWELKLSMQIKEVIEQLGKNFQYDFLRDCINISFTQNEIDYLLSNYENDNLKNTMVHFTSLLIDYIYSREFQERFSDYSSRSVQFMKRQKKDI